MKIAKATAAVSPVTFSNIVTGIIRSKFTAVMLGTQGVGLFSQAFNFFSFFISLASLGMRMGVTKYVSEYSSQNDDKKTAEVISRAIMMQLVVAGISIAVIGLFSGTFSYYLFASRAYAPFLFLMSLGIPFVVLSGTFESALLGLGDYKSFARGRVAVSVLALVPLFLFIWGMKVKGTFWYLAFSAFIGFMVFYYLMGRHAPRNVFKGMLTFTAPPQSGDTMRLGAKLLSYGGTSFITGAVGFFCVVFSRTLLIKYFGLEANGLYQVVFAMSSYYLALFTNGLWSYYYPRISAMKEPEGYAHETNQAIRFSLLGILPFLVGLFIFRFLIIHVLFSDKFLPAAGLFRYQLLGDLFFLMFYIFGTSLLAREKLKIYIFCTVGYGLGYIGLFIFLSGRIGLAAMPVAYLAANLIAAVLLGFYHSRILAVRISGKNIALAAYVLVLLSIVFFTGGSGLLASAVKIALCAVSMAFLLTKEEKDKTLALIMRVVRRR